MQTSHSKQHNELYMFKLSMMYCFIELLQTNVRHHWISNLFTFDKLVQVRFNLMLDLFSSLHINTGKYTYY